MSVCSGDHPYGSCVFVSTPGPEDPRAAREEPDRLVDISLLSLDYMPECSFPPFESFWFRISGTVPPLLPVFLGFDDPHEAELLHVPDQTLHPPSLL